MQKNEIVNKIEANKAYLHWYRYFNFKSCDEEVSPFLNSEIKNFDLCKASWLRKARHALFLSSRYVAEKMNIKAPTYKKIEESEIKGTISLLTLARAAEAMDCELVYAIRPKQKILFSKCIWQKLLYEIQSHEWVTRSQNQRRLLVLSFLANYKMNNAKFKREHGWSQKANRLVD